MTSGGTNGERVLLDASLTARLRQLAQDRPALADWLLADHRALPDETAEVRAAVRDVLELHLPSTLFGDHAERARACLQVWWAYADQLPPAAHAALQDQLELLVRRWHGASSDPAVRYGAALLLLEDHERRLPVTVHAAANDLLLGRSYPAPDEIAAAAAELADARPRTLLARPSLLRVWNLTLAAGAQLQLAAHGLVQVTLPAPLADHGIRHGWALPDDELPTEAALLTTTLAREGGLRLATAAELATSLLRRDTAARLPTPR